jgi:hypothetical protein
LIFISVANGEFYGGRELLDAAGMGSLISLLTYFESNWGQGVWSS